ncbi:MAG: hypothetical protein CM1200mP39_17210 [Dehalococcoidia bacterium]|nr:MAG: hypothetical protein CM1200mP39_17210 [Dehalococcoidia bacterium]
MPRGVPARISTISLGEFFLPYFDVLPQLMSMDVEEMIRGLPIDGLFYFLVAKNYTGDVNGSGLSRFASNCAYWGRNLKATGKGGLGLVLIVDDIGQS